MLMGFTLNDDPKQAKIANEKTRDKMSKNEIKEARRVVYLKIQILLLTLRRESGSIIRR